MSDEILKISLSQHHIASLTEYAKAVIKKDTHPNRKAQAYINAEPALNHIAQQVRSITTGLEA